MNFLFFFFNSLCCGSTDSHTIRNYMLLVPTSYITKKLHTFFFLLTDPSLEGLLHTRELAPTHIHLCEKPNFQYTWLYICISVCVFVWKTFVYLCRYYIWYGFPCTHTRLAERKTVFSFKKKHKKHFFFICVVCAARINIYTHNFNIN